MIPAARRRQCSRLSRRFIAVVVIVLAGLISVHADADLAPGQRLPTGEYVHEFRYRPAGSPPEIRSVHVAGTFNNWSTNNDAMVRGQDGVWRLVMPLSEGIHHYKFVVNGDQWHSDPEADRTLDMDDNHGGMNSGVFIGPDGRKLPAPVPNHIRIEALRHHPDDIRDCNVASPDLLGLFIRTQQNDVEDVHAVLVHNRQRHRVRMYPIETRYGFERYGIVVPIARSRSVRYYFELKDGSETIHFASGEAFEEESEASNRAYVVEMTPPFTTPDWARHAVWYQIFPERFRNGDPSNDPGDKDYETLIRWQANWWETQPGEVAGAENFYRGQGNVWRRRYGGDIQGLIWSLPYLRELGVNAIYLNPVFQANSMHKYDANDFRHIDDRFGFKGDIDELQGETDDPSTWQWTKTDRLFLHFLEEAKRQGFRVIIDGVFNHVGRDHYAFQDVLKNGRNSRYADWFDIRDWNEPIKYIAWDRGSTPTSDGHLPVFKKDPVYGLAPGPREHIFAITKRWMAPDGDPSRGIDGWRLDVANDVPHAFWIEWRKLVKSINPDAYICGEIWSWAHPWLKGDQFDAVMNYRFADAGQQFFVNQRRAIPPTLFAERLHEMAYAYPFQVSLVQQNLYDSHDTDRLASMFVNPDLPYDGANRLQDNGPNYNPARPNTEQWTRMKQAGKFQMTFVGAPMIYYGTEAGMWSPDDPSNRQPMVWPDLEPFDDPQVRFRPEIFEAYRRAVAARHTLPVLRKGFFHTIIADDSAGVYGFQRTLGDERAYVVLNRSAEARVIRVPVEENETLRMIDWLDPSQAQYSSVDDPAARTVLAPNGARVLNIERGLCTIRLEPYGIAVLTRHP